MNVFIINNPNFTIMSWRSKLDPKIREHFEDLVKEVANEENAYKTSKKASKAQLWVALAVMAKRVSDLEIKFKQLEKSNPQKKNSKIKKSLKNL